MIALTFDDGPDPTTTPQALAILKKYNAKATFFMVGKMSANPDIAKQGPQRRSSNRGTIPGITLSCQN